MSAIMSLVEPRNTVALVSRAFFSGAGVVTTGHSVLSSILEIACQI